MSEDGGRDCEVTLLGIGIDSRSGIPVMVLREPGEAGRAVPIWIGPVEAAEIARLASGEHPPRPLTHQLLVDVVAALGQRITHVTLCGLSEGTFLAEVALGNGTRISARPSDAVPVAIAAAAPIYAAAAVLEAAAVPLEHIAEGAFANDPDPAGPAVSPTEVEAQAEALRSWLDSASADDFDAGPGDDEPEADESD
jgi:bifunctional DNase/RNase